MLLNYVKSIFYYTFNFFIIYIIIIIFLISLISLMYIYTSPLIYLPVPGSDKIFPFSLTIFPLNITISGKP